MLKKELVGLYNGLNSVGNLVGVIFGYAVNKNLSIMKPEIEALQKAITPSKEFLEYDNKRIEIVKKYALKDDKEQFIIKNNSYDIGDKTEIVEEEVKTLKEEYKDAIKEQEKQIEEYNALLETESDVKLYMVKREDLPKQTTCLHCNKIVSSEMTVDQQKLVFPIIEL